MRKILVALTFLFSMFLPSQSFACGGCRDAGAATAATATLLETFENLEAELAAQLEATNSFIKESIVKVDERNNKEIDVNIATLEKTSITQKQIAFTEAQNVALENIINKIIAINAEDSSISTLPNIFNFLE